MLMPRYGDYLMPVSLAADMFRRLYFRFHAFLYALIFAAAMPPLRRRYFDYAIFAACLRFTFLPLPMAFAAAC